MRWFRSVIGRERLTVPVYCTLKIDFSTVPSSFSLGYARSAWLELSSSPNFVALSWIFAFASLPLHASIPSSLPPSSSSDSARDTRLRSRRQIGVISTVIKTRRNPRSQELAAACSIATTAWKTRGGAGNRADNDTWPWVQQEHVKTEPRTVIRQWLI